LSEGWTPTAEEWSAIRLSFEVGLGCVLLVALPATAAGWLLARKDFWGKTAFDTLVHLPLVLPPVVTGYILLWLLGREGWIGSFLLGTLGLEIAFTFQAAVLASAVMGLPLMVRSVRLAIELVDQRLEDAAATLGASPPKVWLTVTLPLAWRGIATGLLLAFARSLGEFGATVTFAGNIASETRTMPLAIYTWLQVPGGDVSAGRLVVIALFVSVGALVLSEWLTRRKR
jgi:molybdate transport system permease protein